MFHALASSPTARGEIDVRDVNEKKRNASSHGLLNFIVAPLTFHHSITRSRVKYWVANFSPENSSCGPRDVNKKISLGEATDFSVGKGNSKRNAASSSMITNKCGEINSRVVN